jgi:plastocyanin
MGAWRSLWRVSVWLPVVVCLLLLLPRFASAQTREIFIGDTSPSDVFFRDSVSGTSTTTITAGAGVRWRWGVPPTTVTVDFHSTVSGTCPPCGGSGLWDSGLTTPGPNFGFTQGPGTFGTAFSGDLSMPATPLIAPFQTAGTYQYFCGFHGSLMTGTIIVQPGPLHHFDVVASVSSITAGSSFNLTVTAKDQFNNTITGYAGTVHLDSNDPNDTMPANNTLVSGTRTFTGVILRTSGTRTVTANDVAIPSLTGSDTVTVNPAAATQLVLTAPGTASPGVILPVTATARDQFNNTATGYSGTVHFTSSDGGAILPADNTLSSGTRNFSVTLATPGLQTLTVTDTVAPTLTDTASISVSAACSVTFSNPAAITIPLINAATPYPSTINVDGLKSLSNVSVTLHGVTHTSPNDIDVLLVGPAPDNRKMIIMSDAGGLLDVNDLTFTLSDTGTLPLPASTLLSEGTFKPTNHVAGDTFLAPAPAAPYLNPGPAGSDTFASSFGGTNPNGVWSLYVIDDGSIALSNGTIAGGWSITFAAPPNTFCNQGNITIPIGGASTPYPSTIEISGLDGTVRNVSLRLDGLTHRWPIDIDMLLVGPLAGANPRMVVLSDAGGGPISAQNMIVTLDDSATSAVPVPLVSGVFRPLSDGGAGTDAFPPDAPQPPPAYSEAAPAGTATLASTFAGINPNGTWKLYINDDVFADGGTIARGWALSFDIKPNTTTTLTSSSNPGMTGPNITITANVTSTAPGTPTGTVSLTLNGSPFGTLTLINGTASQPIGFPVGTFNFVATYNGDANFNASTSATLVQVVERGPTTTSVISSPNPSTFGQDVTFTATVSEQSFLDTGGGTVTFRDGAVILGSSPVNAATGVAIFTTNALGGGSRSITAAYSGNVQFLPSTSPVLTQTVNKAGTTTTVASSVTPSTFGNSVTFTATVSDSTTSTPTGMVTFRDGVTTLGTGTLSGLGVATFSTSALTGGSHSINAVYGGDGNFDTSTSPSITQTVNKATPSTILISLDASPTSFGDPVTFRALVTAAPAVAPTGTVTFKDGPATLGTSGLTSGAADFSTSTLSGGSHNITAVYDGDGNYNTQTSDILVHDVNAAETTTVLGSSPNPSTFGQPVTFTATVSSGAGTPAGTVTFMDGATPLGAPEMLNGLGVATFTTPSLTAGVHSITAIYNSNGSFATSTSSEVTQNVSQAATTLLVTAPKETSVFREAVTFTVAVNSSTSGTPTGTVTFFDGITELGSASLNGVGEASITIIGLPVGKRVITVQYSGDGNFPANTSLELIHYRSPKPRGQP